MVRTISKEWRIGIAFLVVSTLVGLGLAEGMARVFFPLNDGRDNVTLDGKPIKEWFPPGSVYRQVSNEYDARTTITDKGIASRGLTATPTLCFSATRSRTDSV